MNVIGYRYHESDMHYFMLDFRREFQARESMLKVPVINNEYKKEYLYLEKTLLITSYMTAGNTVC